MRRLDLNNLLYLFVDECLIFCFFISFSSSSFADNASGSILCCFGQTHSIIWNCWECHHMKEQWEPAGEMLSVITLQYQFLVWDSNQEMKGIAISACNLTQILHNSLICAASFIQSTLQCFDRTLFVEIVSKPSSNVTFSYSTNYMNESCFLPMHQKFEASKSSLSSVL